MNLNKFRDGRNFKARCEYYYNKFKCKRTGFNSRTSLSNDCIQKLQEICVALSTDIGVYIESQFKSMPMSFCNRVFSVVYPPVHTLYSKKSVNRYKKLLWDERYVDTKEVDIFKILDYDLKFITGKTISAIAVAIQNGTVSMYGLAVIYLIRRWVYDDIIDELPMLRVNKYHLEIIKEVLSDKEKRERLQKSGW